MQLGLLFRIIRSRFFLILGIVAVTMAASIAGSLLISKRYSSTTELHVDLRSVDPVTGAAVYSQQTPQQYLATQIDVIKSERVVQRVISQLNLDKDPAVQAAWAEETGAVGDIRGYLSQAILKSLDPVASLDGSTIRITYESGDPVMAADIVNAFAEAYVHATVELKAEPAAEAAKWFASEAADARKVLAEAQARLSAFQQASGIVSSDERFDVENQRLNELSTQLVAAQGEAADARSRLDALKRRGRDSMPEVASNALIQTLKSEMGRAEARLGELSSRLGPNNPQYIAAQSELNSLRSRLGQEIGQVGSSIEQGAMITVQREATIRREFEAQRTKVQKLKHERDQMAPLLRDVESAQRALDQLMQRSQDTKVTSRASLTNVTLLTKGAVPSTPSRPKPMLNLAIGAFLGLFIGILAAMALEMLQRPLRTPDDLMEFAGVPVLAVLPPSNSNRPQRLIGGSGPSIRPPTLRLGN